jgi:late competence protein required for DNA uptake (superfamily II DNA/RNA helicase)
MYYFDESLLRYEVGKVSSFIRSWCGGRELIMNIVTVPYNSSNLFMEAIMNCIEDGRRVMYITGETEGNVNIINSIRKNTDFRDYSYVRSFKEKLSSRLIICSIEKASFIEAPFDLYIYDDIGSLSETAPVKTLEHLLNQGGNRAKLICCSAESIFKGAREISIPARNNGRPLAEPRIILTRLNLTKEMPITAFQFVEWSISCSRKVIIYVPHAEKVRAVQNYMSKYMSGENCVILSYIKEETSIKTAQNFMALKRAVIITDDCSETFADCMDTDILVCFTDDNSFSAKKLFYLLSRVGRRSEGRRGEAIFLASEDSYDMEKAKNMARDFNKEAWEIGLLKT